MKNYILMTMLVLCSTVSSAEGLELCVSRLASDEHGIVVDFVVSNQTAQAVIFDSTEITAKFDEVKFKTDKYGSPLIYESFYGYGDCVYSEPEYCKLSAFGKTNFVFGVHGKINGANTGDYVRWDIAMTVGNEFDPKLERISLVGSGRIRLISWAEFFSFYPAIRRALNMPQEGKVSGGGQR